MKSRTIVALVEGEGDKRALPILVQRQFRSQVHLRIIDMHGKSNIVRREKGFEDTVARQRALGNRTFIVLMDADTLPPYRSFIHERIEMERRTKKLAARLSIRIEICWAMKEFESWLIGGIHRDAKYCGMSKRTGRIPIDTESAPHDPKRWLRSHLDRDYEPRTQECLAHNIDLLEAKKRNASLEDFFMRVSTLLT